MKQVAIIAVGLRKKDIDKIPSLAAIAGQGSVASIVPPTPAVTCTSQATFLTGRDPSVHGIVGNGWYHRDTREIRFWLQPRDLIEGPTFIDRVRAAGCTVANLFWWFNMGCGANWSLTPRPEYPADGRKLPSVYGEPPELPVDMQQRLGRFPLFDFWGPRAGIPSTRWIVDASIDVIEQQDPDLLMVYLPHLDYDHQRHGPDSAQASRACQELDRELSRLLEKSRAQGADVMVLSEYGIEDVDRPVFINRELAQHDLIGLQITSHGDLLDVHRSDAFAVCDHQLAHVHLSATADRANIRHILSRLDGVERVLGGEELESIGLAHHRSGDLVLLAEQGCWFAYPWWHDDSRAPDYARTVDIHRKPGYDPAELFIDPALNWPRLKVASRLLQKKLGMRALLDVISTDPSMVKGSHGRLPSCEENGPVLLRSWSGDESPVAASSIHDELISRMLGRS
ncbi:MAG: nucleotide pyrophosphatase/phosphodiesterase family protein [Planctomycetota bacterium]